MSTTKDTADKKNRLINFAHLSFLIAWSLGIVFLICKQYFLKTLLLSSSPGTVFINDFLHFYCAGQMVLQGQGPHAYDPQVQMAFMDRLISPLHVAQVFYIQYVPFVFLLSVPLALMSTDTAFWCWAVFSTFCIGASALLLHKLLPRFSGRFEPSIIFLGLFATLANFECLQLGQLSNFLLLLLSVYTISLLRPFQFPQQKRLLDIIGGVCLSISSMKPHYALLMAVPAFVQKRWLLLAVAAGMELILLAASGLVLGWDNISGYPHIVLEADANPQYGGVHPEHMVSVRGVLSRFLDDPLALKASMLLFLLPAAAILANKRNYSLKQEQLELLIAFVIILILVMSPHTNLYDCVLLVLPAYLLLPGIGIAEIFKSSSALARTARALIYFYPLFSAIMFVLWEYVPLVSQNPIPFFIWHLILLVALAGMNWKADNKTAALKHPKS